MIYEDDDTTTSLVPFKETIAFQFDSAADTAHVRELLAEYNKLKGRLSKLSDGATIGGMPVISYILKSMLSGDEPPNFDELAVVGKALQRVAELYPKFMALHEQIKFINYARSNPKFVAWAFGTFDADIATLIGETQ